MDENDQKREERGIFDFVYSKRSFDDVKAHENPDFLARHFPNSPNFGVEVTKYYTSETDARLDRISGYVTELLDGERFRHKDDPKILNVTEVDILRNDDTFHAKGVPAVIQKTHSLSECARQVAHRISSKAQRLQASTASITHTNLVIEDRTGLLRRIPKQDFYRSYFVPELVSAITTVPFREIILVTTLQDEHVYAPLKMLYLIAEAYLFNGVLVEKGFAKQIPAGIDDIELFAAYLNSTVAAPVLVHHDTAGSEVIFGDSGILIGKDNSVVVRLHSDYPISPDAMTPDIDWQSILGVQFHDAVREYRDSNTFSTEAVFPVSRIAQ